MDQRKLTHEIQQRIRTHLEARTYDPVGESDDNTSLDLRELSDATSALAAAGSSVGQSPPAPATLRGRLGAFGVQIVSRMLFWYTPQIRAFHQLVAETAKRHANALRVLGTRTAALQKRLEAAEEHIGSGHVRAHAEIDSLRAELTSALSRIESLENHIEALDRFCRTGNDSKQPLQIYLKRLLQAGRDRVDPVLDISCGRGEWLELLMGAGFVAHGVDSNHAMILSCRERGLHVTEADALTHMRALPDACMGAVTGFHIAGHVGSDELMQIVEESVRILKPGGIAIFETPDPVSLAESRGFNPMETVALHPHSSYAFIGRKPR